MTDAPCSVGGGNHPLSCPPSFCCPTCGDPYPDRCGCRKRECPACGALVFFLADQPTPHMCSPRKHPDPALMLAQGLSELAMQIFEAGRVFERGCK